MTALEKAWLFHEIGRCHLELNDATEAKQYGDRSLEVALEANDSLWQLNAKILVAQSESKKFLIAQNVCHSTVNYL